MPNAIAFTGRACPSEEVFSRAAEKAVTAPTTCARRATPEASLGSAATRAHAVGLTGGSAMAHEACTKVCIAVGYRPTRAAKKVVQTAGTRLRAVP